MHRAGPAQKISNVFVLMLENHSFDNMFAMSEIPGLTVATTKDFNESKGKKYYVKKPALSTMPTDPHHEFNDVVEQLCGMGKKYSPVTGYPPIDNSGFAASYATTSGLREGQEGLIMECFETQKQLPVIYKLATEFAICDHWYSSLPGPTWPNRFFIHLGYSNGLDDSPSTAQMAKWETVSGFTGEDGSVFDQLNKLKKGWRLYGDKSSRFTDHRDQYNGNGGVAQVASLKNISLLDVNPIDDLPGDFLSPYEAAYTFIEPNYGSANTNYKGGSSQHPMDDTYGGEALIKFVYESLRNSPIWETSLLLITYDEHGGFYDSVAPPQAPPPNRSVDPNLPVNHFFFKTFGVRVPAVVVSPYIPKGTVSDTEYDHTSLLKTLQELFGIMALTDRQDQANSLMPLLDLNALRTDCPTSLPSPFKGEVAVPRSTQPEVTDDQLLPEKGNFIGTLGIILKTNIELFAQTQEEKEAMRQEFLDLKTYGQANAYIKKVTDKVDALIGKKRFRS
ncbi:MAG: phosphoesterase [Bacteroidia bacterium]|nr:phosphoesterase [Bacteroidia bacterium]